MAGSCVCDSPWGRRVSTKRGDDQTTRNTPPDDSPSDRSASDAHRAAEQGFPRPFGPYVLLGAFGKGGMGEVYLARRGGIEGIEKLCVLKLLRADLAAEKEYIGRFLDEARVVIGLQHAHICPVFDVGRVHNALYLAMEYLQGVNLRHVVDRLAERGQSLPPEVAAYIVAATLAALHHAHRHEDPSTGKPLLVVHRDVSPHNIMITFQGEVKLIDFGLAASSVKREETESQLVMGKVAYMSPEQARGDEVDARTDQFAIAIVLYELLTGTRFYGARKTHEIWQVVGPGGYVPEHMAALDEMLRPILLRALAEDPSARFASCEDFREELLAWLARRSPSLTERRLRELMQESFGDEIDGQRAMAQRLLARDGNRPAQDDGDPTFSSGPTVTSMLRPGQRAALIPVDSAPQVVNVGETPSSSTGRSSKKSDDVARAGLTVTSEHDSGTEATVSSMKLAVHTNTKRSPALAAMTTVASVALLAVIVLLVRDFGQTRVQPTLSLPSTESLDEPGAENAPMILPLHDAAPVFTDAVPGSVGEPPVNVVDAPAPPPNGTPPAVGDATEPVDPRTDLPAPAKPAKRPEKRPTAPDQTEATSLGRDPDAPSNAGVNAATPTEATVSAPHGDAATTTEPAKADREPSLEAIYERLARCPIDCSKKVIGQRTFEDLEESAPELQRAFRLLAEPCLERCPR
jgi:serine/threonine protein kinase